MNNNSAYVFQGSSLIIPEEIPDSRIHEELSPKSIDCALKGFHEIDCERDHFIDSFTVPDLEGRGGVRCISLPEGELPHGWKAVPVRQVLINLTEGSSPEASGPMARILRSCHISLWRRESRFCGSCGGLNNDADTEDTARQCSVCGRIEFPRITPAVITLIINDKDEVLLAHNIKFPPGLYSLIAGFNEAGESLEDTVAREIKEEVNINVREIRYVRSQPWPFPNSLMMGFTALYDGGELRPDQIEIEDAKWFSRDALPSLPSSGSMSRYLIELWLEGQLLIHNS